MHQQLEKAERQLKVFKVKNDLVQELRKVAATAGGLTNVGAPRGESGELRATRGHERGLATSARMRRLTVEQPPGNPDDLEELLRLRRKVAQYQSALERAGVPLPESQVGGAANHLDTGSVTEHAPAVLGDAASSNAGLPVNGRAAPGAEPAVTPRSGTGRGASLSSGPAEPGDEPGRWRGPSNL